MSYSCPMSFIKVDSNVSRINSLFVSSFVIAYLLTSSVYIIYFIFLDFSIKLFLNKEYSPIFVVSRFIKKGLKLKDKLIDGGSKRLAAYFGLLFAFLLIVAHYFYSDVLTYTIAIVFLSCALLDVIFDYCLGCKIYFIIKKIYPDFMC